MRTDIIRIYKSLHTWTGIIAGMALFIAFYAGALTVFKEPIARWATPPAIGVDATPLAEVNLLIQQTIDQHPAAARDFFIHLQSNESLPARMHWQEVPEGADDHNLLALEDFNSSFDGDGKVIIGQPELAKLAEFIDVLHRVIGLPVDVDLTRWVMGIFSVLYFLALISGVIVLLPTLTKDFLALRLGKKNLKRQWLDTHNVVGIASLPFHIIIALTAAVFAFHDPIYGIQGEVVHEQPVRAIFRAARPEPKPIRELTALKPVEELLSNVKDVAPDFTPTLMQYVTVNTPFPMLRVWGYDSRSFGARAWGGFAVMDPFSGEIISREYLPDLQDTPNAFVSSFFAMHFATFGGSPVRWMYFFLGLAGAWLFYSGNLLWVESRRKKQRGKGAVPAQRRDTRLMAGATVGVCIGAISGISLMMVVHKWLSAFGFNQTLYIQLTYYAVFFSFICWAMLRGGGRTAAPQLWLAALFTAAIPLTSLLGWMLPESGLWSYGSVATLGVDLTALAGSLCLAWMARVTSRRSKQGAEDSVWSDAAVCLK